MTTKIKRLCSCGCEQITNPGRRYVCGHNRHGIKPSKETRVKLSLSKIGNKNAVGQSGHKLSEETKIKLSITNMKCDPNYEYCDAWKDREYRKDLRKDYCENIDCIGITDELTNHHINLNKKDCRPENVITLCRSCHGTLHHILRQVRKQFGILIINRETYIRYIHKKTRQVIATINRKES